MSLLLPFLLATTAARITVKFPPTPLPQALQILSKETGLKLDSTAPLKDDVLVARLKDADVELVLARIAESLYAKWETMPDGTRVLKPDPAAIRKRESERIAKDRALWRGSLDYVRKRLAEQPKELDAAFAAKHKEKARLEEEQKKAAMEAQDWARALAKSSIAEETPGWRATARLVQIIPEATLLNMPYHSREVWAEKPTASQRAFPPSAGPILAQYRREMQAFEPSLDVTRVRLRFTKWESTGAFNVQLEGLGEGGKVIATGFVRMNNDNDVLKVPFDERTKADPKPGEKPIELDAETLEMRRFMSAVEEKDARERAALTAKWNPRLTSPTKFEPTAWHTGADLVAAAEGADKNLIGTVGDITGSSYREKGALPTPSQVIKKGAFHVRELPDGWLLAIPGEVRTRGSRAQGEALLTDSLKRGGVSVDAAAAWTSSLPDKWPMLGWIGDHLQALLPGALNTIIDDEGLRFWGSLTETQHLALRRGETLRLGNLIPGAKVQLRKMIYWWDGLGEGIEPTEVLPNGIADGTLRLSVTEQPVFIGWTSNGGEPDPRYPWTAELFGSYLARGNSYREITAERYRAMDRFKVGTRRTYLLKFALEPGAVPMELSLAETFFDPAGKTLDKLPAPIAADVEKARQATLAKPVEQGPGRVIPPR